MGAGFSSCSAYGPDGGGTADIKWESNPRHAVSVANTEGYEAPPKAPPIDLRIDEEYIESIEDPIRRRNMWSWYRMACFMDWLVFCRWMDETWRVDRSIPQQLSIHWQYVQQRLIPSVWRATPY